MIMRTTLALLLLSLASLSLTGCGTTAPPEVQVRYQQVAVMPDDDLLVDCDHTRPPNIDDYLALPTWTDKEGMLTDNISVHIDAMGKCNIRWDQLRKWKVKAKAAVDAANAASASAPTKSP
jgi:hypothetical protein